MLLDVIKASPLLSQEKRIITSQSLALLLVHDLLLGRGIEASDGPIKQAILRHKTRLQSEFIKIKVRRGIKNNSQLAQADDPRASKIPRYVRVNTLLWTTLEAIESFKSRGFVFGEDPLTNPSGPFYPSPPCRQLTHVPEKGSHRILIYLTSFRSTPASNFTRIHHISLASSFSKTKPPAFPRSS